jgi:hypothetical protein
VQAVSPVVLFLESSRTQGIRMRLLRTMDSPIPTALLPAAHVATHWTLLCYLFTDFLSAWSTFLALLTPCFTTNRFNIFLSHTFRECWRALGVWTSWITLKIHTLAFSMPEVFRSLKWHPGQMLAWTLPWCPCSTLAENSEHLDTVTMRTMSHENNFTEYLCLECAQGYFS